MANHIDMIQRSKLSEQIANCLEEEIITEGKAGQRLASEMQLVDRFGASRTIIREALKILRARGLITSKTGSGAYITKPDVNDLSHMVSRIILMDESIDYKSVYDVRAYLEAAAAESAAQRITHSDIEKLENVLDKTRNRNLGVIERRDLDFEFHQMIAHFSGNSLLALLVDTMSNVFKEIIRPGIFIEGGIDDAIIRHQRILDALRIHDAHTARQMIIEHLEQSKVNYETYHNIKS